MPPDCLHCARIQTSPWPQCSEAMSRDQRASHAAVEFRPCRNRGVCVLDDRCDAVRRNHSSSLFLAKCAAHGGAAHAAVECVSGGAFPDSEAYSDYSQLVAWTGRNHLSTRAGLSGAYHKTRGRCGRGRGTIGGHRRAELSGPRRHPCGG